MRAPPPILRSILGASLLFIYTQQSTVRSPISLSFFMAHLARPIGSGYLSQRRRARENFGQAGSTFLLMCSEDIRSADSVRAGNAPISIGGTYDLRY